MYSLPSLGETEKVPERWVDHDPTVEEMLAQVKISKTFRGHFVRRLYQARTPGNDLHQRTCDTLNKLCQALESKTEEAGLGVLK